MIEEFTAGDHFVTSTATVPWGQAPTKRLWWVNSNGTPIEVTKENTK